MNNLEKNTLKEISELSKQISDDLTGIVVDCFMGKNPKRKLNVDKDICPIKAKAYKIDDWIDSILENKKGNFKNS